MAQRKIAINKPMFCEKWPRRNLKTDLDTKTDKMANTNDLDKPVFMWIFLPYSIW